MEGKSDEEAAALLEIEGKVRAFVQYVDEQSRAAQARGMKHSPFAPRTLQMVEELRPLLRALDEKRSESSEEAA